MKFLIAIAICLTVLAIVEVSDELKRGNDLQEKQLKLHEIETVAQFCDSHNDSIDYDRVGLDCKSEKQAQTKKYQPKTMPNEI